jgi:hypothetical protein
MGDYYGRENDGSGEGMSNPMTAAGDLIIGGEAGNPERLGVGSNGQVLTASPSGPVWANPVGGSGVDFLVMQVFS